MSTMQIQQQAWMEQLVQEGLNSAQLGNARETLAQLQGMMDEYVTEAARIRGNPELSPQGKEARLAELGTVTAERLERVVGGEVRRMENRLAELEEQLRPQRPDTNEVLEFLRQQEIRAQLRGMDPLEVQVLYQELATSGRDDLTMRAIEEAPSAFPILRDRDLLEAGKRTRGARQSPEAAKTLAQLRQSRAVLRSALASARAELGLPEDDYLHRIARGEGAAAEA